jgi:hypothetical protein
LFFLGISTILIAFLPNDETQKSKYSYLVIIKMIVAFLARAMVSGAYTTI